MFIEFGRLGCKQVICLGDVDVLWLDPHVAYKHTCAGNATCSYDHSILAQALMLGLYIIILKKLLLTVVPSVAVLCHSEVTSLAKPY